jgi:2-phospho-L-lactate guanylyltransferase
MTIWAIVPIKPLLQAKSRLADVLSPAERMDLSRRMLGRTLEVLSQINDIYRSLVISRDLAILALSRKYNALTMTESNTGLLNLNVALQRATRVAKTFGASSVLILPGDLPRITRADVQAIIEPDGVDNCVAVAPDRHEDGTNALFVRPPGLLNYAFGEGSFQLHLEQARAARLEPRICRLPNLALDLDTPDDLRLSQALALAP